jgi:Tat protein translocase TatB subunit
VFDIGLQEMLVIGIIALLVFGPSKLPELGRMVGRALRELRRASDEFRTTVETNLHLNDPDPVAVPAADAPVPAAEGQVPEPASGAVQAPPGPESQPDLGEPYCAQRGARLVHRRTCPWASRIPEAERAYFKRLADARDQGFVECPACEPWEPAA